ncbi:MAG: restriction endonuclease subunit S [Clostridia bacterium]|nr:restriction endonuclease subunit S [Clostridia bacterium]
MKTCKVSDLFDIQYGNSLELIYLEKDPHGVNFVSRTAKRNGVSGKVKLIPTEKPFPAGVLTVAVGGSVLETFLQQSPFYTGFHVMVLSPKVEMTTSVKLYYCHCIRANQYKYSYGRQANATLGSLMIPTLDSVPTYVYELSIKDYGKNLIRQADIPSNEKTYPICTKSVSVGDLFDIENGIASSQVIRSDIKESENWIPYIRPSYRQETSIDAYVNKNLVPSDKVFPAGTLYVSTNGQGSHTFSYVSTTEFVANSDVSVLIPKRAMSLQEKLFYAQCITNNRYKFSYGRKPKGARLLAVKVPEYPPKYVTDYNIDKVVNSFSGVLDMV